MTLKYGLAAGLLSLCCLTVRAAEGFPEGGLHEQEPASTSSVQTDASMPSTDTASEFGTLENEMGTEPALPAPLLPDGAFLSKALTSLPEPPAFTDDADPDTVEPGEVLIATPTVAEANQLRQQLARQGFRLLRRQVLQALEMVISVFQVPPGQRAVDVVRQWQQRWPALPVDANHRYRPLSGASSSSLRTYGQRLIGWRSGKCGASVTLGLLDGPVNTNHPALKGRRIEVVNLLRPNEKPASARHATAIASLLMGRSAHGGLALLPSARLVNAVVFRLRGGRADATAEKLVVAVDRILRRGGRVLIFSLGGPANRLLQLAVQRARSRGASLVAAAGNGGRGGRPVYPAAYAGVIGVTAVDARQRLYARATRGRHVDLAAPGVQVWAAWGTGGRYVSGTSYAVPFVAAALAAEQVRGVGVETAWQRLRQRARDLGPTGRDEQFGYGLLQAGGC